MRKQSLGKRYVWLLLAVGFFLVASCSTVRCEQRVEIIETPDTCYVVEGEKATVRVSWHSVQVQGFGGYIVQWTDEKNDTAYTGWTDTVNTTYCEFSNLEVEKDNFFKVGYLQNNKGTGWSHRYLCRVIPTELVRLDRRPIRRLLGRLDFLRGFWTGFLSMDIMGYVIIGFLLFFFVKGIVLYFQAKLPDERKLDQLWDFANLEPVLGLLGTVMGLVVAFFRLVRDAPELKDEPGALLARLSGGVYTAILTTVIGLVFFAFLLYLYYHRKNEKQAGGQS